MENNLTQQENKEEQDKKENLQDMLTGDDYKKIIENLLFITDRPLTLAKLSQVAQVNDIALTGELVRMLQQEYAQTNRAIAIVEIGGGFQMSTKPEYGRWVRQLFNEKSSTKLSNAALETLAIIAYKQPITRAEIESIRGVDIVTPLEKIMERGLVRIVGKKDVPGKPLVYGTTEEFLRLFGLNSLSQLPELKTFATKEVKEIQDDLPFNTPLPKADTILPLEEGETEIKETSVQNENETFDFTTEPKAENNTQEQITPEQEQKTEQQEQTKEEIKNEEEEPAEIKTEEIIENAMGQDEIK
ncbi:MAG: SMC-Scp complex subunit ScpB [Elusimicrobiaceae bacterium]|nr:SMC-Scp complex subunit ScpB [Elusimicrobiaceae bacterium]